MNTSSSYQKSSLAETGIEELFDYLIGGAVASNARKKRFSLAEKRFFL